MKLLYKYRGIQNFRFFVDIVMKSRLYCAPYTDLNDPMEGLYRYHGPWETDREIKDMLEGAKSSLRLCSLSRDPANELMWSHYAEGHRGVAVGVIPSDQKARLLSVDYDGIAQFGPNLQRDFDSVEILRHKLKVWEYEEEERIFVQGKHFTHVEVKEIVLGRRMSNQDIGFIIELVGKLSPKIRIRRAQQVFDDYHRQKS